MIYIDSNILIYARIDSGTVGNSCRAILEKIDDGEIPGVTSLLTIDEVVWIVRKEIGYKEGISYARDIINSNIRLLPLNLEDVIRGLDLMETGMKPRDAIHSAVCFNHGVFSILTDDSDFRKLPDLEVFGPKDFLRKFG